MRAENTHHKYRKYRKNNKCNKIPDLESKEVKKGPEMSANIAKIAKVTINVVLAIFAIFVAQSFHIAWKILVTFAIFAKFADISKPFLTFSLSKCRILWNLLFLLFLPYLICCSVFSHRRKNSCYLCVFCEICRHLEALLDLSLSKCSISLKLLFLLFLPHLLLNLFT